MSTQNKSCSNCKNWIKQPGSHGTCDVIFMDDAKSPIYVDVRVADDHNLTVRVKTRADFFCSLFENKG